MLRHALALLVVVAAMARFSPASAEERGALPELRFVEIPASARANYVGDRFSYMETGPADAPAVLLLHGIGANSSYWRYQFAALSSRYRLIAWNAPGYYLSDPLRAARPTCRDYADAAAAFAEALSLKQFILVGNSFGSAVAQCFVDQYPGRATRMILSGTSIGSKGVSPEVREQTFQRRRSQFERAGGMGYARDTIGLVVAPTAAAEVKAVVMRTLEGTSASGYLQASFVAYDLDALAFAPRINIPVLLIHGTLDKIAPIETTSVALVKALPNARLVRMEGYGHLTEVEAPDQVNALWSEFFQAR